MMHIYKILMFTKWILPVIIFSITISTSANPTIKDYSEKLYQSYMTGDMDVWVAVINELEQSYRNDRNSNTLFNLIQTQYGYIGYLIGAEQKRAARDYLKKAEDNTDKLLQKKTDNADAIAIKAALLAYNIALAPYKAPFLGPKSMNLIDEALAIDNNSVQALLEKGNATHYAPSMFGGDPIQAIKYYSKALSQMEMASNEQQPKTWLYINTLTQIAMAQEKANLTQDALGTYNRILSIAPEFKWVKDELLPDLKKKLKN
ncbi:MAG: tetratricopeptide repeat protein [Bacteroidales bacterium]